MAVAAVGRRRGGRTPSQSRGKKSRGREDRPAYAMDREYVSVNTSAAMDTEAPSALLI